MILRTYALYALNKKILFSLAALWAIVALVTGLVSTKFGGSYQTDTHLNSS